MICSFCILYALYDLPFIHFLNSILTMNPACTHTPLPSTSGRDGSPSRPQAHAASPAAPLPLVPPAPPCAGNRHPRRRLPIFTAATPDDIDELASNLRPADALELTLATGLPPREAVIQSFRCSSSSVAARLAPGQPLACVFGTRAASLLDRSAYVWMIGAAECDARWFTFARHSRRGLALAAQSVPWAEIFTNIVHEQHHTAVRWLAFLGARFHPPVAIPQPDGSAARFLPFTIYRSAICQSL